MWSSICIASCSVCDSVVLDHLGIPVGQRNKKAFAGGELESLGVLAGLYRDISIS